MTSRAFHDLHAPGRVLVLPNAWDAVSARLVESAGAQAVATSSAALAWAHGHADGEHLPLDLLVATVAAIARVVSVPLTVDVERGYSAEPSDVVRTLKRLADAGAAGVNLEDHGEPSDVLTRKIEACRAEPSLADVFINARTDAYLLGTLPAESRLDDTLARIRRYAEAGADGIFVPRLTGVREIQAVVESTTLPVNLLAVPGLPDVAALRACGVRRLSAGPFVALAALGAARRACESLLERGTYDGLFDSGLSTAGMNALVSGSPASS